MCIPQWYKYTLIHIVYTVVSVPLFLLHLQMWWMDGEMRGGEDGCRFWREECPDRPRHTEALTVTFVLLGSGKISQQAPKAPQTIFQNSPDLSRNMLDAICKLCQCHLSLCSQSAGCKCSAGAFIWSRIGQALSDV